MLFLLWLHPFILSGVISPLISVAYWAPTDLGNSSFSVLSFCLFICFGDSQGKNTEVVCHSLLQWTTFCPNSPPWPVCLGWPYTAWLSFIELDKVVVHVIRLASFLWLWFQSVCPLLPSLSPYCLIGVSLTWDVGYLFMAAPAKSSRCSLPWTWGVSSWPVIDHRSSKVIQDFYWYDPSYHSSLSSKTFVSEVPSLIIQSNKLSTLLQSNTGKTLSYKD